MRQITIRMASANVYSRSRARKHRNVTLFALFVGLGLVLFLTLTDGWFGEFVSTALTLFFSGAAIFLASDIGWRRLFSRSGAIHTGNSLIYSGMLLLWLILPVCYFFSPLAADLRHDRQLARAFLSDASCSSSTLRKLAKQPAVLDPAPPTANSTASSICNVRWTRATRGFEPGYCLQLNDGRTLDYYCLMSFWQLDGFDRHAIHSGDMFVAQTAYDRPSAFLFQGSSLANDLLYPWGHIVKTRNHPEETYIVHLMTIFWPWLMYLFVGFGFAIRLFGSPPP